MAASNYMCCNNCGSKVFYDAMVDYPDDIKIVCLCESCSKEYKIKIEKVSEHENI